MECERFETNGVQARLCSCLFGREGERERKGKPWRNGETRGREGREGIGPRVEDESEGEDVVERT